MVSSASFTSIKMAQRDACVFFFLCALSLFFCEFVCSPFFCFAFLLEGGDISIIVVY